jgi:transposase
MVQGKLTSPEKQQEVLTLHEVGKKIPYIVKHTDLARTSVKRILKKSEIKLKNEYITSPGRPKKIGKTVRNRLRSLVKKDDRKTLGYFQNSLEEKVSKPTLSRVFREIGLSRRKMMTKPLLTAAHEKKESILRWLRPIRNLIARNGFSLMKRSSIWMDRMATSIIGTLRAANLKSSPEIQTRVPL